MKPTKLPSVSPTNNPILNPTKNPIRSPTLSPSDATNNPTKQPTVRPTLRPTQNPLQPGQTQYPSTSPSKNPTQTGNFLVIHHESSEEITATPTSVQQSEQTTETLVIDAALDETSGMRPFVEVVINGLLIVLSCIFLCL